MNEEKPKRRVKVRKTWKVNPVEQVVPNEKGATKRPSKRELIEEALDEFEEFGNGNRPRND